MNLDVGKLLEAALPQLISEIGIVFRTRAQANLPPPTSAEVIAALGADADGGISIGEQWLATHPATTAAPVLPPVGTGG